jgi:hypothetical protein
MQLIAIKPGFHDGERIRRGQIFEFDEKREVQQRIDGKLVFKDGKPVMVPVRMPKWARPPNEALAEIAEQEAKEKRSAGDTKPKAAAAAAQKKREGF